MHSVLTAIRERERESQENTERPRLIGSRLMPVKRTVVLPVLCIVSLGVLASGYSGRTVEVARAHALTGHSAVIARTGFVARAAEGAAPNRRGVRYLPTRVGFAHAVGTIAATSPDLTHSVPW